jgi:hypothetical protein
MAVLQISIFFSYMGIFNEQWPLYCHPTSVTSKLRLYTNAVSLIIMEKTICIYYLNTGYHILSLA